MRYAVDRLESLGGLPHEQATALVDAVVAGAVDHAFELINGLWAIKRQA